MRKLRTDQSNQTVAQPATVDTCRRDYGTPAERAERAEDATAQSETTKWHGQEAMDAPKGWRS